MSEVYHLELRQFPHVTRVFNLDRADLDRRFVGPWVQGATIDHDDRRWTADRTRLKVMVGPAIRPDELGLGRGWGAVTKDSRDVTEALVAEARRTAGRHPEVEALKEQVLARATAPIDLRAVVELPAVARPGRRASERLAIAEQAVWELLHQGRLAMVDRDGQDIAAERWQPLLLSFASWAPDGERGAVRIKSTPPPDPGPG